MTEKIRAKNYLGASLVAVAGVCVGFVLVVWGRSYFAADYPPVVEITTATEDDEATMSDRAARAGGEEGVEDVRSAAHENELTSILATDLVPMIGGGPDRLRGTCRTGVEQVAGVADSVPTVVCDSDVPSFGGLYKQINANLYRGKRIQLSGEIKSNNVFELGGVEGVSAVWIRIDAPSGAVVQNGRSEGVRGSSDWTRRAVTLRVPADATAISLGFWMQGTGQTWARDLTFRAL